MSTSTHTHLLDDVHLTHATKLTLISVFLGIMGTFAARLVKRGADVALRPFDLAKVKIGMQAMLYVGAQIVARAVVDDLGDTDVSAQVVHAEGGTVQLAESMTVHFAERAALGMTLAQPVLRFGRK